MDKNEIARKSHKQAFAQEFSEPGESVAECVVGKIPCPLLLSGWFCRDAGSGKLICRVNSEISSGKKSAPPSRRVLVTTVLRESLGDALLM